MPIFLVAPTSPDARLQAISKVSQGFVYAISRTGITGTQVDLASDARAPGGAVAARNRSPHRGWIWGFAP